MSVAVEDFTENDVAQAIENLQAQETGYSDNLQAQETGYPENLQEQKTGYAGNLQDQEPGYAENLQDQEPAHAENLQEQKAGRAEDFVAGDGKKKWPGWPGESVFRILVPSLKVGAIIGRKGESIKRICDESKARIKILNGPPGAPERAVMVSAKEEQDASISPAMDGLLRVHKCVIDGLDGEHANAPHKAANMVSTRLLVPATQASTLIGKQGSTIKSIQEASKSAIRVLDDLPPFALQDDRIVEIHGEPSGVHKAVELVAFHLRKFLVDHSVLPLFEVHMPVSHSHMEQNGPPPQPWGHPQSFPPTAGGSVFNGNPRFMPPRPHDNFYPPSDYPSFEKPPHHGISAYGLDAPPMMGHPSTTQHSQPHGTQVTQHMQIPLSCADAVIGTAGANISYIRRASGATVTIQETRGVPGEMTVEISGSAAQLQTAQQLIQNFMAEVGAPPQTTAVPVDQGYNSYPSMQGSMYNARPGSAGNSYQTHGPMYTSPPVNAGPPAPGGGGYGSAYGSNYGF